MKSTTQKLLDVDASIDGLLSTKIKTTLANALIDLQEELSVIVRPEQKKAKRIKEQSTELVRLHCAKDEKDNPILGPNDEYTGLSSNVYYEANKALDKEWEELRETKHELPESLTKIPADQIPEETVGVWVKALRPFFDTAKKD